MNYQTFPPHPDLESLVKCHWTLEVAADPNTQPQRIVPDGCIEMIFILGDDVKRYTSEHEYILQPRAMILGQITQPFLVQPTGNVNSYAVRFYPYGFGAFTTAPIKALANKETPIDLLFGKKDGEELIKKIEKAANTEQRIKIAEAFLLARLSNKITIDNIVKSTVDVILESGGSVPINAVLKDDLSKRRQLERKFIKQIGMSPKQLGRVIRLQTALQLLLKNESESLTRIAYESEYYDQAHFIKDFKDLTGITPKEFLGDDKMALSTIFYKND